MKSLPIISSIFLGVFFLFTGLDKTFHYESFLHALKGYVLIPNNFVQYAASPVILSELWIGIGLFIAPWRRIASLSAVVLLMLFIVALSVNYFYAPNSSCGCWFTVSSGQLSVLHVIQNLVFMGLALFVWKATPLDANNYLKGDGKK
ncbi:MAG: DoxX family membrane protein [Ignavibacteriales bacterium]|nr:DoxX family membrane protein [Ignavibacteriales bacterium]